jgi:hypothetical protein
MEINKLIVEITQEQALNAMPRRGRTRILRKRRRGDENAFVSEAALTCGDEFDNKLLHVCIGNRLSRTVFLAFDYKRESKRAAPQRCMDIYFVVVNEKALVSFCSKQAIDPSHFAF